MAENNWNPWKITTIGMAVVIATALVTGLVVANWTGEQADRKAAMESPAPTPSKATATAPARPSAPRVAATPAMPTQAAIDACNRQAAQQTGAHDKTKEVVKDAAIGAVVGAAVGAAGGAIADGGKGAGKGAAIGGVLGAGGGTLYGLNENKKKDEAYRNAYGTCMRNRGYAG